MKAIFKSDAKYLGRLQLLQKLQFLQKISSSVVYGLKLMQNIKEGYSSPLNYLLQQKSGLLIFL